jgi:tRNA pseudouridine55 synthase
MNHQDAIAVIDKPLGMTSHDVVAKVRKLLNTKKVGHAGTLDPQASGVLVLGINRGTRFMQYFVGDDKCYEAVIRLGVSTISDDADGEVIATKSNSLSVAEISVAMRNFHGEIMQRPSSVSAIKVDGKRAHDLVRSGVDLVLPERPVVVHEFELVAVAKSEFDGISVTDISVQVRCSSGTYVRALARDLGELLNVGGSILTLRRTQAGVFGIAEAQQLPEITDALATLSLGEVANRILPCVTITQSQMIDLTHGRAIEIQTTQQSPIAVLTEAGQLVAVGVCQAGKFQPTNVFSAAKVLDNE